MACATDDRRCTRRAQAGLYSGFALALLAVLLSGCPKIPKSPPTDCTYWSTHEQVLAALYSVYFREEQAASPAPIIGLDPLKLTSAAELLRCDPDMDVRSARIRRAAISLSTSIFLLRCRLGGGADVAEFRKALQILGVSPVLEQKLGHIPCGNLTPPQINDEAGIIIDKTEDLEALQRTCCPCISECTIGPLRGSNVADFKISVNRNAPCIFQAIDPQCWDNVCPKNFANTFVFATQTSCPASGPACRSALICDPSLPVPTPITMAPPPADPSNPWCGLLSETVITAANDISSRIETVLKVETKRPATGVGLKMDYGLCESRAYTVCDPACLDNTSPKPCTRVCTTSSCAVERDCGYANVQKTGEGFAELAGYKQLKFSSASLNAWSPFALKIMVGEVADATCRPTSSCPGQPASGCTESDSQREYRTSKIEPTCSCKPLRDSCSFVLTGASKPAPFCP